MHRSCVIQTWGPALLWRRVKGESVGINQVQLLQLKIILQSLVQVHFKCTQLYTDSVFSLDPKFSTCDSKLQDMNRLESRLPDFWRASKRLSPGWFHRRRLAIAIQFFFQNLLMNQAPQQTSLSWASLTMGEAAMVSIGAFALQEMPANRPGYWILW